MMTGHHQLDNQTSSSSHLQGQTSTIYTILRHQERQHIAYRRLSASPWSFTAGGADWRYVPWNLGTVSSATSMRDQMRVSAERGSRHLNRRVGGVVRYPGHRTCRGGGGGEGGGRERSTSGARHCGDKMLEFSFHVGSRESAGFVGGRTKCYL